MIYDINRKGFSSFNIDNNWKVVIDPDNVFWGIVDISLDSLDRDINDKQRPNKKGNGNFQKETMSRIAENVTECKACSGYLFHAL